MKKALITIVSIFFTVLGIAQTPTFDWVKSVGGSAGYDEGKSIAVDSAGNVYTIGTFQATSDFDPGAGTANLTSIGSYDIFISKLDSAGNFLWAKQIGGANADDGRSIALDVYGNVYTTGNFSGTVDFDPGPGVMNLIAASGNPVFISKLDSYGNFIWAKQLGGATGGGLGYSIYLDSLGNIYSTGSFFNTVDFDPGAAVFNLSATFGQGAYVSKLDSAGNFIWAKQFAAGAGGGTLAGNSITVDPFGNVFTTGQFWGNNCDFDPGAGMYTLSTFGVYDIFVCKLDSAGNFIFAIKMGGAGTDVGLSIALDNFGNIYTTGCFNSMADFDPGVGVFNINTVATSEYDIFISKLDSSGNFIWAKSIGSTLSDSKGTSISLDRIGNVYITGWFSGSADFDPGPGVFYLTGFGSKVFVCKLDSFGDFIWATKVSDGGTANGNSLFLDVFGNIYTTGYYEGTNDFNPGTAIDYLTPSGLRDVFIHKMSQPIDVWPGDADHNNVADNTDLLPIGLFYLQTGAPRAVVSNTWQSYSSTDWGITESNGSDIKHADCNGDGVIDNNDTLAINLNFSLTHAFIPQANDERVVPEDLYFYTSSYTYASGSIVDVEIWAGTSTVPISSLYGLAFTINFDLSFVQPSTENITFPPSWLGTIGTDAIKFGKVDGVAAKVYCAETRIDHIDATGFGKIGNFKFQLKSTIPTNSIMHFSTSNIVANNSTGGTINFNTKIDSILINPSSVGIEERSPCSRISVFPNPSNGLFNVFISEPIKNGSIEVFNVLGDLVLKENKLTQNNEIELKDKSSGLYLVKIMNDNKIIGSQKILLK